jgi:phosphoserine phosphatase
MVTFAGPDRPGIVASVFKAFADEGLAASSVAQVRDDRTNHMTLTMRVEPQSGGGTIDGALRLLSADPRLEDVEISVSEPGSQSRQRPAAQASVTVVGAPFSANGIPTIAARLASSGANIDGIRSLGSAGEAYRLATSGVGSPELRELLADLRDGSNDIAVQPGGPIRRHLILLDVDNTLIRGDALQMVAHLAGRGPEFDAVPERGYKETIRDKLAVVAGVPASYFQDVYPNIELTPGARQLVATAQELGHEVAIASGGFTDIVYRLAGELNIDRVVANVVETTADGRLTGDVVGRLIDGKAKADALELFAAGAGIPMSRTMAVGDGVNDVEMLGKAALGAAFMAEPEVRDAASTTITDRNLAQALYYLDVRRSDFVVAGPDRLAQDDHVAKPPARGASRRAPSQGLGNGH